MSAKSASLEPQPCRQRNSGRRGAALPPPREYCTCVTCSGSPNLEPPAIRARSDRSGCLGCWSRGNHWSRARVFHSCLQYTRSSGAILPVTGRIGTLGGLPAGGFSHWLEESGLWMACKRDDCASGWRFWDVGRLASGVIVPVSGGFWTLSELPAGGFSHWLEESTR